MRQVAVKASLSIKDLIYNTLHITSENMATIE